MSAGQPFDLATPRRRVVVFADLAESVRLFREHPSLVTPWREYAEWVSRQLGPDFGGRLVRTTGDGLLLEFSTASQAVEAALAMHAQLAQANGQAGRTGTNTALWLRIGLHVAEVVADEHELWGSGVNIAARVATLAQPGQTVATVEVREEIVDGLHSSVQDMGLHYLKHLPEPTHTFLLHPPGARSALAPPSGLAEDLRPAIAVVPFVALPADAQHDALGHAVADDVIANLSRHPGLRVLSRASTAAVRGSALDTTQLRKLLGASFLLTGHFYVRGQRVRLAAELCELQGGQVLWAGSVRGDVGALFEGEDDLVPQLVAQIAEHVMAHELTRVRSLPMTSLASYSLLLGAGGLLHSLIPRDFERAHEAIEHLTERHPRQAAPQALMSSWHLFRMLQGWTDNPHAESKLVRQHAQRALDIDPQHPNALVADAAALVFTEHDFASAGNRCRQALEVDPHHPQAWARLSESQSEAGEHAQAIASATRALNLSPLDRQRFLYESYAARAAFVARSFGLAATHARNSVRLHALHAPAHRLLIAALWQDGEVSAAREAASGYVRLIPGANASGSPKAPGKGQAQAQTPFVRALHDAGVPL